MNSRAIEATLKESQLDEAVAEIIALWTKGCPPKTTPISPSIAKVMYIMESFTAEDTIEKRRENNPKNFQSDISDRNN
ncbi:hypothetical protein BOTCAL_2746g00010 [Botryotinia calthae]|uniref:Uncharacterized protein n=1 Tax=Botryotinia calthae TaxID=38488 RepID=A0A4Y8C9V1_9HELO|nr:hypothetical protein BOTCAL_2746g00010 [Botryotinia calthae]